jgi:hypothetical protein
MGSQHHLLDIDIERTSCSMVTSDVTNESDTFFFDLLHVQSYFSKSNQHFRCIHATVPFLCTYTHHISKHVLQHTCMQ